MTKRFAYIFKVFKKHGTLRGLVIECPENRKQRFYRKRLSRASKLCAYVLIMRYSINNFRTSNHIISKICLFFVFVAIKRRSAFFYFLKPMFASYAIQALKQVLKLSSRCHTVYG